MLNSSEEDLRRAPLAEKETNSAPETPVNVKFMKNSPSSPSSTSGKSIQSDCLPSGGVPRSIAITHSRSRLRLKLLPPGKEIINPVYIGCDSKENDMEIEDNFGPKISEDSRNVSSPNFISEHDADAVFSDCNQILRRSVSNECINPPMGGGLMGQALMAAQVLSLIPTESARERYIHETCVQFTYIHIFLISGVSFRVAWGLHPCWDQLS